MPDVSVTSGFDKVVHFVEYGILGFLLFRVIFSSGKASAKWSSVLVILFAAAVGALDESYQSFTGRDSNIYDWFSDLLGATIAAICCLALYAKAQEKIKAKRTRNFHS